jgi:hypothetical protein
LIVRRFEYGLNPGNFNLTGLRDRCPDADIVKNASPAFRISSLLSENLSIIITPIVIEYRKPGFSYGGELLSFRRGIKVVRDVLIKTAKLDETYK